MEIAHVGRWTIECDPNATREAFSRVLLGSAESCGCADCRNFAAFRDRAYPSEALSTLGKLGIDSHKESEIWHTHRDESGFHNYGGFFHFIGTIHSGRDVMVKMNGYSTYDFESIGEHFAWGLASEPALIPQPFTGFPITQFEFAVRIPWVIDKPEPD